MASYTDAIIAQAGPHMLAARARAAIAPETGKGCDAAIWPQPVAMEPAFEPITVTRDVGKEFKRPDCVYLAKPEYRDLVRLKIWLSPNQIFRWDRCELFLKQLVSVSNRVGLEIIGNAKQVNLNFLCMRQDVEILQTSFMGKMPDCRLSVLEDIAFSQLPKDAWDKLYFRDFFPQPPYFHLLTRPDELHDSSYESLAAALMALQPPDIGFCQILFEPVSSNHNWHRNIEILIDFEYAIKQVGTIGIMQRFSQQSPSGDLRNMALQVETKAHNDKPFFATAVRAGVVGPNSCLCQSGSMAVFMNLFQHGGRPLRYIAESDYHRHFSSDQLQEMFLHGHVYRPGFLLNSSELAGLVHIPPTTIFEKLAITFDRLEPLTVSSILPNEGTPIGTCTVAGRAMPVCIPHIMRLNHTHVIGKPGKGKSTTLESMIMHDINNGHGVAVIDPHGDMAKRLLTLIPEHLVDKVIYFAPGDKEWIPLWNPLALKFKDQDIGKVADDFVSVLKSFVSGWGDRMEHFLRHSLFALLHINGSTFNDVNDILRLGSKESNRLKELVLKVVQNQLSRNFWLHDFDCYRPEELGPPRHKLSKLLLSDTVGLMLSQPRSSFDIDEIMNSSMIFLADLSGVGTEYRNILGGFLLAIIHTAALARSKIAPGDRKPFHGYLDEAHRFVTDSLEDIIAETRKYGVSLTLAHQYMKQFQTEKADALGSVGSTIAFNVDTRDATFLVKDFQKIASVEDFITLEVGEAIVRIGTQVAKIATPKPLEIPLENFKDRIIARSRQLYYRRADEIREMLSKQHGHEKLFVPLVPTTGSGKPIREKEHAFEEFK